MNDDVQRMLGGLVPRCPSRELRGRVLAAVDRELAAGRRPRWDRRAGVGAAAAMLLGVVLNLWVIRADNQRRARLFPPPPVPATIAEIGKMVAGVTDAETGQWVEQRLLAARRANRAGAADVIGRYQRLLEGLNLSGRDWLHETTQEGPQVDRDRQRGPGGRASDSQRRAGLDHRFTA